MSFRSFCSAVAAFFTFLTHSSLADTHDLTKFFDRRIDANYIAQANPSHNPKITKIIELNSARYGNQADDKRNFTLQEVMELDGIIQNPDLNAKFESQDAYIETVLAIIAKGEARRRANIAAPTLSEIMNETNIQRLVDQDNSKMDAIVAHYFTAYLLESYGFYYEPGYGTDNSNTFAFAVSFFNKASPFKNPQLNNSFHTISLERVGKFVDDMMDQWNLVHEKKNVAENDKLTSQGFYKEAQKDPLQDDFFRNIIDPTITQLSQPMIQSLIKTACRNGYESIVNIFHNYYFEGTSTPYRQLVSIFFESAAQGNLWGIAKSIINKTPDKIENENLIAGLRAATAAKQDDIKLLIFNRLITEENIKPAQLLGAFQARDKVQIENLLNSSTSPVDELFKSMIERSIQEWNWQLADLIAANPRVNLKKVFEIALNDSLYGRITDCFKWLLENKSDVINSDFLQQQLIEYAKNSRRVEINRLLELHHFTTEELNNLAKKIFEEKGIQDRDKIGFIETLKGNRRSPDPSFYIEKLLLKAYVLWMTYNLPDEEIELGIARAELNLHQDQKQEVLTDLLKKNYRAHFVTKFRNRLNLKHAPPKLQNALIQQRLETVMGLAKPDGGTLRRHKK